MKLIKINTDHYVLVDDSEIKEGDWIYNTEREPSILKCAGKGSLRGWQKITHSTQALGIGWKQEVIELSLQEVKELIGEVDVAEISYLKKLESSNQDKNWIGYGKGIDGVSKEKWKRIYNQALEDNKEKKYTEEYLGYLLNLLTYDDLAEDEKIESCIEYIKDLLQPKTEWEVEIVDGKLKLKS